MLQDVADCLKRPQQYCTLNLSDQLHELQPTANLQAYMGCNMHHCLVSIKIFFKMPLSSYRSNMRVNIVQMHCLVSRLMAANNCKCETAFACLPADLTKCRKTLTEGDITEIGSNVPQQLSMQANLVHLRILIKMLAADN